MTQTIIMNAGAPDINPLYIKLRRRFSCEGNRTIGEVKAEEAIRDGYQPYATPARRAMTPRNDAAECHVTRANSLPNERKQVAVSRRTALSGSTIAILVFCAFLMLFLLFSGLHISELNRELAGIQHATELHVEDGNLSLTVADAEIFAAEGADNNSEMKDVTDTSNLLRAFSKN